MNALESKRVCLPGLALAAICVLLGARMFYSHPKSIDQTGIFNENILIIAAIFVFYVATKAIFSHKALHHKITIFDFGLEKIVTPVSVVALFSRYTSISFYQILLDPIVWIFAILLSDPWQVLGRCLQRMESIKSGRFLRPILSDKPHANLDYLQPFVLAVVLYVVLWW